MTNTTSMTDNNRTAVETMTALYDTIRQHHSKPEPSETLQATLTKCITRLARWHQAQQPVTDEDAALVIELLEVVARGDFDNFFDELADMEAGDDLPPLQRLPAMPAIFEIQNEEEETEATQ